MPFGIPLKMTLALGAAGWLLDQKTSAKKPTAMKRAGKYGWHAKRRADASGAVGDLAGTAGERLAVAAQATQSTLSPLLRSGGRQAQAGAELARERLEEFDAEEFRRQAAEIGARAGETALELSALAGEKAAKLGVRATETAAILTPALGKLAVDTATSLNEARETAGDAVALVLKETRQAVFSAVRDLAITGAAGAAILYIYAPEREQQQQILETAQGVAFGAYDFGKGVQQLVNDVRSS